MTTYLWTVRDKSGVEVAQKVNAATAQEAREMLEAQGFTDLKLVKDDIMAEISAKSRVVSNLSAAEQVKNLKQGKTTFGKYLVKVARDVFSLTLLCGILIWWRWTRHDVTGEIAYGLILAVAVISIAVIRLNTYLFGRMIEAREWHRAEEVLRLLGWMKIVGRLTHGGLRAEDAARYRSMALVWQGKVEEGLAEWTKHESKLKEWTFVSHLSSLHEEAGNLDQAFELREKCVALNPSIAVLWADLAWKYLQHDRNLPRAKEAMAQVEKLAQPELAKPHLIRNRGIIAMREGRCEEAEKLLQEALGIWEASKGQHYCYSNRMLAKAFLCQARAKLGKSMQARIDFAEAKTWLKAAKVKTVLESCEALV